MNKITGCITSKFNAFIHTYTPAHSHTYIYIYALMSLRYKQNIYHTNDDKLKCII